MMNHTLHFAWLSANKNKYILHKINKSFTPRIATNLKIIFSFGGIRLYEGVPRRNNTIKIKFKRKTILFFKYLLIDNNIKNDGTPKANE